jgi:tetratricopeptide (TPR) repeat protein
MPRLQDIELFKRDLAGLSHEAEVLERWGEKPEAIAPPEGAAAAPDVSAPESAAGQAPGQAPSRRQAPKPGPKPAPKAAEPAEEGAPPDFAALLDGLPLGPEGEAAPAEGASMDDELAALLGSLETGAGEAAAPAESLSEPAAPTGAEESAMPDFGDFSFDEGAAPVAEAAAGPEPAAPEAVEEGAMPDFGGFSFEEAAPAAAEDELTPEPAAPGTAAEGFDFTMPELGEAAEPSASAEAALEAETFAVGEEGGAPEEAAPLVAELQEAETGGAAGSGPAEDFSIPDFDLAEEKPAGEAAAEPAEAAFEAGFAIPDLEGAPEKEAESLDLVPEGAPPAGAPRESAGAELGADAFESFTFEEPGAASEPSLADFGTGGPARDLDTEIASLSEEAPIADTFKIDQDWGGFGGEPAKEAPPRLTPSPQQRAGRQAEEKYKPVSLSEAQVDRLQDTLLSYPLNLRVAIEDIVANAKGSDAQQARLVWSLVEGAAAESAAAMAGRILKRHIPIPKGHEKRTGAALEAEKGSLAYAFVHTFLPVVKIGLLVLAATLAVGYLGWRYIYVPLAADHLYRTGYQRIAEDRYPEAETNFAKATAMREFIAWYYRYAEAYAAKRQYILAEKKYAALVAAHPKEKKGILAWAKLEKDQLKYEEAVDVLKGAPRSKKADAARGMTGLLSWDYFNKDGLLLLGDVYLDWGEEAPAKYEEARRTYATLLEHYGEEEVYLERMLLYFIRVDKLKEVLPLKAHFLSDPRKSALSAQVLAELGGYLLDKGRLEDLRDILLSAAKKGPEVPEAHYNLARYFRRAGDPTEERKALDNAVRTFAALPARRAKQTAMYIDSLIWRGRFLAAAKEMVSAETDYAQAAAEYEKALELRRVRKSGRFAEAYAGIADVAYEWSGDLAKALAYYDKAEADGFATADTCFRRGNILYGQERYADSLEKFYAAQERGGASPYLDYAFGSALNARKDFFAAEAYYRRASAAMAKQLENAGSPAPQERPSEIEILGLYLKSENNLGVALYRSAARSGDARRRNEAMAALTHSVRLYDLLSQEPEAIKSLEDVNLALKNMNALIDPKKSGRGDELLTYSKIEKDMAFPRKE